MKLSYLGHSCFLLTSTGGVRVITDPYQGVGYFMPQGLAADVVTVSHGHFDHNYVDGVKANAVVSDVKAFRLGDVEIRGVSCYHDDKMGALRGNNIAYVIKMGEYVVCHLGDIGEEVTPEIVRAIGKVDMLLVPVGGRYTVDAVGAKKYANAISPKVVVPMHYKPTDGTIDITDATPFLSLYEETEISRILSGELFVDEKTHGIVYMERVK